MELINAIIKSNNYFIANTILAVYNLAETVQGSNDGKISGLDTTFDGSEMMFMAESVTAVSATPALKDERLEEILEEFSTDGTIQVLFEGAPVLCKIEHPIEEGEKKLYYMPFDNPIYVYLKENPDVVEALKNIKCERPFIRMSLKKQLQLLSEAYNDDVTVLNSYTLAIMADTSIIHEYNKYSKSINDPDVAKVNITIVAETTEKVTGLVNYLSSNKDNINAAVFINRTVIGEYPEGEDPSDRKNLELEIGEYIKSGSEFAITEPKIGFNMIIVLDENQADTANGVLKPGIFTEDITYMEDYNLTICTISDVMTIRTAITACEPYIEWYKAKGIDVLNHDETPEKLLEALAEPAEEKKEDKPAKKPAVAVKSKGKKNQIITLRVNQDDLQTINENAAAAGMRRAKFFVESAKNNVANDEEPAKVTESTSAEAKKKELEETYDLILGTLYGGAAKCIVDRTYSRSCCRYHSDMADSDRVNFIAFISVMLLRNITVYNRDRGCTDVIKISDLISTLREDMPIRNVEYILNSDTEKRFRVGEVVLDYMSFNRASAHLDRLGKIYGVEVIKYGGGTDIRGGCIYGFGNSELLLTDDFFAYMTSGHSQIVRQADDLYRAILRRFDETSGEEEEIHRHVVIMRALNSLGIRYLPLFNSLKDMVTPVLGMDFDSLLDGILTDISELKDMSIRSTIKLKTPSIIASSNARDISDGIRELLETKYNIQLSEAYKQINFNNDAAIVDMIGTANYNHTSDEVSNHMVAYTTNKKLFVVALYAIQYHLASIKESYQLNDQTISRLSEAAFNLANLVMRIVTDGTSSNMYKITFDRIIGDNAELNTRMGRSLVSEVAALKNRTTVLKLANQTLNLGDFISGEDIDVDKALMSSALNIMFNTFRADYAYSEITADSFIKALNKVIASFERRRVEFRSSPDAENLEKWFQLVNDILTDLFYRMYTKVISVALIDDNRVMYGSACAVYANLYANFTNDPTDITTEV